MRNIIGSGYVITESQLKLVLVKSKAHLSWT